MYSQFRFSNRKFKFDLLVFLTFFARPKQSFFQHIFFYYSKSKGCVSNSVSKLSFKTTLWCKWYHRKHETFFSTPKQQSGEKLNTNPLDTRCSIHRCKNKHQFGYLSNWVGQEMNSVRAPKKKKKSNIIQKEERFGVNARKIVHRKE